MSGQKKNTTPAEPKSAEEMLGEIRQVIKDWQLLRGAMTPCRRETLLDILRRDSPGSAEEAEPLISRDLMPDRAAWRRIGSLPNDDEAMAKIESIVGMTPKRGELGKRWDRWFSRHLVPWPTDPEA